MSFLFNLLKNSTFKILPLRPLSKNRATRAVKTKKYSKRKKIRVFRPIKAFDFRNVV